MSHNHTHAHDSGCVVSGNAPRRNFLKAGAAITAAIVEVAVVRDATVAAIIPEGDGYLAAITNFRFIANAVWNTSQAVDRLNGKD